MALGDAALPPDPPRGQELPLEWDGITLHLEVHFVGLGQQVGPGSSSAQPTSSGVTARDRQTRG